MFECGVTILVVAVRNKSYFTFSFRTLRVPVNSWGSSYKIQPHLAHGMRNPTSEQRTAYLWDWHNIFLPCIFKTICFKYKTTYRILHKHFGRDHTLRYSQPISYYLQNQMIFIWKNSAENKCRLLLLFLARFYTQTPTSTLEISSTWKMHAVYWCVQGYVNSKIYGSLSITQVNVERHCLCSAWAVLPTTIRIIVFSCGD